MKTFLVWDAFCIIFILGILCIYHAKGDCKHNGRKYMTHTVWQPGPCTVCTCEDPIVLCETIRCTDPICDYDKGEYLQISADSCCPECVPQLSACQYQDQNIPHGTEWQPEPCSTCVCTDGEVTCAQLQCPAPSCRPGDLTQTVPGRCCPQCISAGRSCHMTGQEYADGADWEILPCTKCVCRDGQHDCYPIDCPPVVCAQGEVLETLPGGCCPVCQSLNITCREGNKQYKTGQQWNRDPCTLCVCIRGTVVCTKKECMDLIGCARDEKQVSRPGECCSECVPQTGDCEDALPVRYNGDIWNVSSCEYCMCQEGTVECHTAVCENIVCFKEEVLVHRPGTCCPQCVIPPTCEHNRLLYQAGEQWAPDACSVCRCDAGVTVCYTQHCPPCPSNTKRISLPGECCGTCQKVECSPECSDCQVGAPSNCTRCTNPRLYVQDGRCLHTCRMGWYPAGTGVCLPCHHTCYTCAAGTRYHCDMCQPGLMWKHGQCVDKCGLGYYLQNGRCLVCDPSCKSCNGPKKDQCTSCENPAQVIFQGECQDECPQNYYIRSGKCIVCNPTCKTCTPDGTSCATCWQGGLLHLGQCVTSCSVGYYPNSHGSCSPCHPSCESCSGGSNKNCTSCPAGSNLSKKGKCRSSCEKGQYRSSKGKCKDCAPGCSECHEAWSGGTTVCTGCESRSMVPSGSGCADTCKSSQFQELKACKECGENCQACTSPSTCTRCASALLLYQGLCVNSCAQGQYEDGHSCSDCSRNCLRCYSNDDCSVCDGSTFIKEGRCVEDCGPGFLANPDTRECDRNTVPPTFKVLRQVKVRDGGIAVIDNRMVYLSDPDTAPASLRITLLTTPDNGHLFRIEEGQNVKLEVGQEIKLADMHAGRVRFQHLAGTVHKGKASLRASDGQLSSPTDHLYFQAVSSAAITVRTLAVIHAIVGAATPIRHDQLDLATREAPDKVTITVLHGPKHGAIYNSELQAAIRSFTVKDIHMGRVVYKHDGQTTTPEDNAVMQASDGVNQLTFIVNFEMRAAEDKGPVLMRNKVGHVTLGEMLKISADLLLATRVTEGENGPTEEVVYTLNPPLNNPQDGEIMMVVPIPASGVGDGWEDLGDGNMAARMSRFLQRDIDEGRIFYKNKGRAALTDIVKFEVADSGTPGKILTDQTFMISVREKEKKGAASLPVLAPGITLGMTVSGGQLVPVSRASLEFEDRDTKAEDVQYTVMRGLGLGQGQLEHVSRPRRPLHTFSQADVNNGSIVYRPPGRLQAGSNSREVAFYFTVSDGQYVRQLEEHKFSVYLEPINSLPPRFLAAIPVLQVSQGGTVPIGSREIKVKDDDTPLADLTVTLNRQPHRGQLQKVQDGLKVSLRQGDKFTYTELDEAAFVYQHDGSVGLFDTLQLSVSDGLHSSLASVDIAVTKVDKHSPYKLPDTTCHLDITEGTSKPVNRDIIGFGDNDDSDDQLNIVLNLDTVYGKLLLNNKQVLAGDVFTQADINNGKLSFLADSEIGKKSVTEMVMCNVTDSTGNLLPSQALTVLIEPDNNQPPRVKVVPYVKVYEGGHITVTSEDVVVTDPDSRIQDLVFVIDSPPRYGEIKDIAPVPGSEILVDRLVSSFPVEDLVSGYINYVQSDHKGREPTRDGLVFHVTDGKNRSPSVALNFSIMPVNDEAPMVVAEQVFLYEGQTVAVSNFSLYVVDIDSPPQSLEFTLEAAPVSGVLRLKSSQRDPILEASVLKKDSTFTYKDILAELLFYSHDGTENTMDAFQLTVTDGTFTDSKIVNVIVMPVNDEVPRMTINRGLRVHTDATTKITSSDLSAGDVDSDDKDLLYTLTSDLKIGSLLVIIDGTQTRISARGPVKTFTQTDIDNGHVEFKHVRGETTGNTLFKFTVSDSEGNQLIDQDFHITILEDRYPPEMVSLKELVVVEGGTAAITSHFLQFSDPDSDDAHLTFTLATPPQLGQLESTIDPDEAISEFTMADIAAGRLLYHHTSKQESFVDSFTFQVSDGTNAVTQAFTVTVQPVDDSIPVVSALGLRVQEGVRKFITEFELKATDVDTKEDLIMFSITSPPQHGSVEHLVGSEWLATDFFSMTEVYNNLVSYRHDGTETTADSFRFTVTDSTNNRYSVLYDKIITTVPGDQEQEFPIKVLPVDDDTPILEANLGLHFLEVAGLEVSNKITTRELQAKDRDTPPHSLKFVVRVPPQHGRLDKTDEPGKQITAFTQADIDNGIVRYVLTEWGSVYEDSFTFDLYDSKPNRIPDTTFHITWSVVSFEKAQFNVTETAGIIRLPVRRYGNLKEYSIITCRTRSGTAISSDQGSRPGQQDYVEHYGQVQFDKWQDVKMCIIIINDDSIFEGAETFSVELTEPTFTLLGDIPQAVVTILDPEDEPVLQFKEAVFHVNEKDSYLSAPIVRSGDISSTVSTVCFTTALTARGSPLDRLESGSDYISRGKSSSYRIVFQSGVTMKTCDVKIIDDSVPEASEQFELQLTQPSYGAKLGPLSKATVVIDGPNDESQISFAQSVYQFAEDAGTVAVEIVRQGSDLAHTSTVWCATRLSKPVSAAAGQDYIPSSSQITFSPSQASQFCHVTILDDDLEPRIEGNETFAVFLSSSQGSSLATPHTATVVIQDQHLDVPTISFPESSYSVDEGQGVINVPVLRAGDTSRQSSVICYTRQASATVVEDFIERPLAEASRVVFLPGDKIKNCTVEIVDDRVYEENETFHVKLDHPVGTKMSGARLGDQASAEITITNKDDVPTIQFEKVAYSIAEPSSKDQVTEVVVKVVRSGDISQPASVRCSTHDGSAQSGTDYNPRSTILVFEESVRSVDFVLHILYNSDIEWHETFSAILGPGDPVGAELGPVAMTTITILDNDVSASLVLPAPPVVVSLLKYDDVEAGMKISPSPGYPLVCITPCNLHHPSYHLTHTLCEESKINHTAMFYRWEVSMPEVGGSRPPFVEITYNTVFASVNNMVLDSIFFRPSFRIRCVAQPLDESGNPGIPLKSQPVIIGRDNSICKAPLFSNFPYSHQAQSFVAKLEYVGTEDKHNPNRIHVAVEIPHQDGMLPLISTFPLTNLKFVLSELVYRQQHVCSNLVLPGDRLLLLDAGFISNTSVTPPAHTSGYDFPYQFDTTLRENRTLYLYQHLNLKTCMWRFDAWYHMTDLVDLCGGKAVSDFQVSNRGQTYLTVKVPLYVSYLYATAPVGWSSLEQRTEMEFSFYYDTVLWKTGLEAEGDLGGKLQVMRVLIGNDGRLVVDFKTLAKFRGLYVLDHHTLPGYESRMVSVDKDSSFDLDLLWGQSTFDGPHQLWRATSEYSLKDYTGEYMVEMIPCTVQPTQSYTIDIPIPCTAHQPQRFQVPIAFQQSNQPVPLEYTLDTHFQLGSNERRFLEDPFTSDLHLDDMDPSTTFSKGDRLYGRVLWSPEQNLEGSFTLMLEKVFVCTGRDGYIPTYDPTGSVYNNGPQYGCIQPRPNLKYRFLILDRGAPNMVTKHFENVPFDGQFASDNPQYASMLSISGVDGFAISVDPLYKVTSGYQWYIQVIYSIAPSDPSLEQYRNKRSAVLSLDRAKRSVSEQHYSDWTNKNSNRSKNGTNIKTLLLNATQIHQGMVDSETDSPGVAAIALPIIFTVLIIAGALLAFIIFRKRKRHKNVLVKRNNLQTEQKSPIYRGPKPNNIVKCGSSVELKETIVHKSDRGKPAVRVKDTNIQQNKNLSKVPGTEV